jgi:hypothetical protein
MCHIDGRSNCRVVENGQPDDGLCQHNPSQTDLIVRRGQETLQRLCRSYEDWIDIAEALQVGRAEVMAAVHTNQAVGRRYEKAMAEWFLAHSFHVIDKGARKRLLDCLQHRAEIEKWRATLTDGERFRFNHPDTVLRKWKAATAVPDPNKPSKPSPMAKLQAEVLRLDEDNHRMRKEIERGGGDLWSKDDRAEDIAAIMVGKLTSAKAEAVARAIQVRLKETKRSAPREKKSAASMPASQSAAKPKAF